MFRVERLSEEELEEVRICEECGREFTIEEAFREFDDAFLTNLGYSPDLTYDNFCDGEYCGECAIDLCRERMAEPNDFEEFREEFDDEDEEDYA